MEVCHFFITLQFNHIYSVCGKNKFSFVTFFFLQSFELAMQDSHPSLYGAKAMCHLYIPNSFW